MGSSIQRYLALPNEADLLIFVEFIPEVNKRRTLAIDMKSIPRKAIAAYKIFGLRHVNLRDIWSEARENFDRRELLKNRGSENKRFVSISTNVD